jgi:hypothetical protein
MPIASSVFPALSCTNLKISGLEQEHCFSGREKQFPGIEVLLALYNFMLSTA